MIVYLLTNTDTEERYVGCSVKENVLEKHRTQNIIPKLHNDLKHHNFEYKILHKVSSLDTAEQLERFYIQFYNTKENGYNTEDSYIFIND